VIRSLRNMFRYFDGSTVPRFSLCASWLSPLFVAYQVSELSRSSNLISRVSRMKSRASIAAAP